MPSATAREFQNAARNLDSFEPASQGSMNGGIIRRVVPLRFQFMEDREIGARLFFKLLRQLALSLDEFQQLR